MQLQTLTMQNFKCYENKHIEFSPDVTLIQGAFGTGKSTIYEACKYALDIKADFEPIDRNTKVRLGSPENPITTTVEIMFVHNGVQFIAKRQNVQKFQDGKYATSKPTYWFDNIKCKSAKEYHDMIANCLDIDYALLPMLFDIKYFNNSMDKNDRYNLLNDIFDIDNQLQPLKNNYAMLTNYFYKGYDETYIHSIINENTKKVNDRMIAVKTLISDKRNASVIYAGIDYDALTARKTVIEDTLSSLANNSNKANKSALLDKMYTKLGNLRKQYDITQAGINEQHNKCVTNINIMHSNKSSSSDLIAYYDRELKSLNDTKKKDQEDLDAVINDNNIEICAFCGNKLLPNQIARNQERQSARIDELNADLKEIGKAIKTNMSKRKQAQTKYDFAVKQIQYFEELDKTLDKSKLEGIQTEIDNLQQAIKDLRMDSVKEDVINETEALKAELNDINDKLAGKSLCQTLSAEITALESELKELATKEQQTIAIKNELFAYELAKAQTMDRIVNSHFTNGVSFIFTQELTAKSIKGAKLACECCFNGINYNNLSTGQKIYVNCMIMQILQKHYDADLPIWIDDYQCFGEMLTTDRQLILIETTGNDIHFDNIITV